MASTQTDNPSALDNKGPMISFETVYERYYMDVFRFYRKRTDSLQDAEDLTADVFLYCYKNFDRFDPTKSSITTWLYLIAKSLLKTHYRDRKQNLNLSDFEEWLLSDDPEITRAVYLEQLRGCIAQHIRLMPEKYQKALIMRYFYDKDFDEIAKALHTSYGNVRVIISRAISKLRLSMNNIENDWRE